jgi:malonyl-CoA O-methyltransferase
MKRCSRSWAAADLVALDEMQAPAQFVDQRQVRRNFARAAATYDEVAVLQREVGSRMLERLDYVRIEPQRVLDLGCGTGASLTALHERYPEATADRRRSQRSRCCARPAQRSRCAGCCPSCAATERRCWRRMPAPALSPQSIGLLWSNLMLHWLDDPLPVFREAHRLLEVGGAADVLDLRTGHPEGTARQLPRRLGAHAALHRHA